MAYEVLARKWRPQVFQDVIGQEHITQTLLNAIKTDRLAHAYLFSGARGVGKTSVARILAKAINCQGGEPDIPCNRCHSCHEITGGSSVDVQEIDGASNRGIDEIRELRENIKYMPSSSRFRIYIIDEVHMLTKEAFNALLKTLEEPPSHVKFFFATTEPHKVPVTILSRCQRFDFKRIPLAKMVTQIEAISRSEDIEISRSGLMLIARQAEGSMRDAESLLDQVVSYAGPKVEDKSIAEILGIIDRDILFEASFAIIKGDSSTCLQIVDQVHHFGYDIREFYRTLMDQFRNLLVSLVDPGEDLLDISDTDKKEIMDQARLAGQEKLQQILGLLINREEDVRTSSRPRLVLETLMIRLCRMDDILSFEALMEKIESLERRLSGSSQDREMSLTEDTPRQGAAVGSEKKTEAAAERASQGLKAPDWQSFLTFLSSRNRAMSNVIKEWTLQGMTDDTIDIAKSSNSFSASYLDDPQRLQKLEELCGEFFKRNIRIRITQEIPGGGRRKDTSDQNGRNPTQKASADIPRPVQEILQAFQGEMNQDVPAKE